MAETQQTTRQRAAAEAFSRTTTVKWKTPSEEIVGAARVASVLLDRKLTHFDRICVAVPNRNWALQAKRGLATMELPCTVCLPIPRISAAEQAALAALDALARPGTDAGRAQWQAAGRAPAELDELAARCCGARGRTLIHDLGIDSMPAFEHGLLHVRGNEAPGELGRLLRTQLSRPTMPRHITKIPVMDYHAVTGRFDYLFLIGCVDGLVPRPAAFEAADEDARRRALEADRAAFLKCTAYAKKRNIVSYFTSIDERIAQAAHIRYKRVRHDGDATLAICSSTMFLKESGAQRPTTIGGQTFLREFSMN